jgi:hypothetical protein
MITQSIVFSFLFSNYVAYVVQVIYKKHYTGLSNIKYLAVFLL